ncbi:MAG TPA: hypothetical protein DHV63_02385 [Pseudomonas sp.]|nr:hypothetical protein [Pseudomonas sp.]
MDVTTGAREAVAQWGVVYPYGGVLATFENEQDAEIEATAFGGAVVRIVSQVCSVVRAAGAPTEAC